MVEPSEDEHAQPRRDLEQRAKQIIEDRADEYRELDAWASVLPDSFVVRCPSCETLMHLGEGWMGCTIPECPECNDSADTWADDPTISEDRANDLMADERNLSELVHG